MSRNSMPILGKCPGCNSDSSLNAIERRHETRNFVFEVNCRVCSDSWKIERTQMSEPIELSERGRELRHLEIEDLSYFHYWENNPIIEFLTYFHRMFHSGLHQDFKHFYYLGIEREIKYFAANIYVNGHDAVSEEFHKTNLHLFRIAEYVSKGLAAVTPKGYSELCDLFYQIRNFLDLSGIEALQSMCDSTNFQNFLIQNFEFTDDFDFNRILDPWEYSCNNLTKSCSLKKAN